MIEHPIGYRNFHVNKSINFQLNRWLATMNEDDLWTLAGNVETLSDWKREMLELAVQAEKKGQFMHASSYYRAAVFYMHAGDENRNEANDKYLTLFERGAADSYQYTRHEVAYEGGCLPAIHVKALGQKRSTIVVHGGYDSSMEELLVVCYEYAKEGHDVIFFEGPGQGQALRKYKLKMTLEWEKPVSAILDYFQVEDCTLIGFSLGGFLAPRAAAYEPRIKRVIALDVLFDFFDCFASNSENREMTIQLGALVKSGEEMIVNKAVRELMSADQLVGWSIEHGMEVSGAESPYEFFVWLMRIRVEPFSDKIHQDFLLLAGNEDHIVPVHQFFQQAECLVNVHSLTTRMFTKSEQAQNHCQVGNAPLLNRTVLRWIDDRIE